MLNVYCRFGLHNEGDEREDEEEGGVDVFSAGLVFGHGEGG